MAHPVINGTQKPKITLWTHHGCGWCHRVHITLKELNLEYEEVLVDLDVPRPEWFLKLNPRGLVPVMRYVDDQIDEILTESQLIVQFLIDLHPSHLLPSPVAEPSPSSVAAFSRWRMGFIVDTYFSKVNPLMFQLLGGPTEEQEQKVNDLVTVVQKQIEPLLHDADPYFGGRAEFTLAEVLITPFILRLYDFADDVIWPSSLARKFDALPAFSKWAHRCMAHDSVTYVWDKELRRQRIIERLAGAKAKYRKQ